MSIVSLNSLENDPYYSIIFQKEGLRGVEDAGYFETAIDYKKIDYRLNLPCTPLSWAKQLKSLIDGGEKPCVLIAPGSFCPPHQGHIDMMEAAKQRVEKQGFTCVAGFLSPGHDDYIKSKTGEQAIPIHKRIAMCESIVPKWMFVDPWEGLFTPTEIIFTHVVERLSQYIKHWTGYDIPVFFVCGRDRWLYSKAFRYKGQAVVVSRPWIEDAKVDLFEENNILMAPCNSSLSSTEIRKTTSTTVDKVALTLRVEDTFFQNIEIERELRIDYRGWINVLEGEYTSVQLNYQSEQLKKFKKLKNAVPILSLDALINHHVALDVSRHYDLFGSKMLTFERSPESVFSLDVQLDTFKQYYSGEEHYIYDDDIHTTGGTIRFISGLLAKRGIETAGALTFKVSDNSQGEILDVRDFMILPYYSGLVIELENEPIRAPYLYPYVCPYTRASITNPMEFSLKMWELNAEMYKYSDQRVSNLGSMEKLFVKSGFAEPSTTVYQACLNHISFLKSLN